MNAVEDFRRSDEAQAWWKLKSTQQALKAARESQWVDYSTVTMLKLTALKMARARFSTRGPDDDDVVAFRDFVARAGESLYWQAAFDAIHARQAQEDPMRWGWPAAESVSEHQQPGSAGVL